MKNHSDFKPLKRPRYFEGQLLSAADLTREQDYSIEKHRRHNRSLHGFGIVSGLSVIIASGQIVVSPGLALDCLGNELVIETSQSVGVVGLVDLRTAYLGLKYVEKYVDPVPVISGEEHASVLESFALSVTAENSNRNHKHTHGRWLPCGQPHELTIAKLRATPGGWRVDRRYRPPAIK